MSYQIVWADGLIKKLADAWEVMSPSERRELTDALHMMDQQLQNDPLVTGESRDQEHVRFLIQPPLAIWFRVNERLRIAQIFAAHIYKRE